MKRPMIFWVSLFILGEIISLRLSGVGAMLCLFGVLVLLIGTPFLFRKIKKTKKLLLLGSVFLIAGTINIYRIKGNTELLSAAYNRNVGFSGQIVQVDQKMSAMYYTIKTDKIFIGEKEYTISSMVRLVMADSHGGLEKDDKEKWELLPGDYIQGEGTGQEFGKATNPGEYDEKTYMFGKGIYLSIKEVSVTGRIRPDFSIRRILFQIRNRFLQVYHTVFSEKDGSLAAAMVLGDKSGLDKDVKMMYQQNGIAHLIAISGLHIAMIGGTLYQILRKIMGGYVIPVSMGVGFVLLYGMMTGLSGATCRAVIMLAISFLSQLLGRKYDILTAVSFSLLLMLMNNPFQITQAGFLLSYGAILGIAVINPVWKMFFSKLPKWTEGLFVSLSVQISLTPIMLYYFYEIPVYSVILNIIVVPIMSVLLFFLLMSGMVGLLSPDWGWVLSVPVKIIFRFYEWLCGINEQLPGTTFCMGKPEVWWIIVYYAGLFFLLVLAYDYKQIKNVIKKVHVWIALTMILFVLILLSPMVIKSNFIVCMFDVGQGDGIYIRTPQHYHILVDGGSSSKSNVGKYVLKNGLKYYGCKKLDYAVITHSDSDHYSGIKELLEEGDIEINNLILPGIANPDSSYYELEELALKRGCHVFYMCRGDSLTIDEVIFRCLNPQKRSYEDKNTGSLVFLLQYRGFDMLLTGDMDWSIEKELLNERKEWISNKISGSLDVLKVSHHGSDTATSEEFLALLKPKVALISVGENNRYGHPHKDTMIHLQNKGCKIYETMKSGQIMIKLKGRDIVVKEYLKQDN